jgi:hypothetical protein
LAQKLRRDREAREYKDSAEKCRNREFGASRQPLRVPIHGELLKAAPNNGAASAACCAESGSAITRPQQSDATDSIADCALAAADVYLIPALAKS